MQTELMTPQLTRQEVALRREGTLDLQSLLTLAIQQNISPDAMEKMLALSERMAAIRSKADFDAAMAKFQSEMPLITKTKVVKTNSGVEAFRYAPFEDVLSAARPVMQANGFSFKLDTDVAATPGFVIARCYVKHNGGHTELTELKFPIGTKTQIMSDTQVYAAALTFASRRAFSNAFGIVTVGEDKDGATPRTQSGPSTQAPADVNLKDLARELWNVLASVRGPDKSWNTANQFMVDEGIISDTEFAPDLSAAQFKSAIAKSKARLSK